MTAFRPTQQDRRRALVVLLVGITFFLAVLYAPVLAPWWAVQARLSETRAAALDAQRMLHQADRINAAFAARREQLLASGLYLSESAPSLASAGLAQRLQQAASDASTDDSVCVLGNRLPVEEKNASAWCEEARMRVDLQCGGLALQRFLHSIEDDSPRVRIDRLTIALAPNPLGFDKPMGVNQPLNVSLDAVGCLFPSALTAGTPARAGV